MMQGPSAEFFAKLLEAIGTNLYSGPAFCYDPSRSIFAVVLVQDGVIVHWQIEPARNQVDADALRRRYLGDLARSMAASLQQMSPSQLVAATRELSSPAGDGVRELEACGAAGDSRGGTKPH